MAKKEKRYSALNVTSEQTKMHNNNEAHLAKQFKIIQGAFGKAITLEQSTLSTFQASDFYASDSRITEVVKILVADSRVDKVLLSPISALIKAGIRRSDDFTEAVNIFGSIRAAANHAFALGECFGLVAKLRKTDLMNEETAKEQKAEIRKGMRAKVEASTIITSILRAIGVTAEFAETSAETLNKYLRAKALAKSLGNTFTARLEIAEGKIRYAALAQSVTA